MSYRSQYYERRVDEFLTDLNLPREIHDKVKKKLLEPITVKGKKYSNFMEKTYQSNFPTNMRLPC